MFLLVAASLLCVIPLEAQFEKKTYHFCGSSDFAPYSFVSDEKKEEGYSVDLIKVLSATMDMDINFHLMPLHECVDKLKAGEIDGVIGMPQVKNISKYVDYSTKTADIEYAIFVESKNTYVNSIKSLAGTIVSVQKLSPIIDELKGYDNITLEQSDTVLESLRKLEKREVAAVIACKNVALYYIQEQKIEGLKIVGSPIPHPYTYAIAVHKNNKDALKQINKGIEILENNETIEKLQRKWFGLRLYQPIPWKSVIVLSSGVTGIMLIFAGFLWVVSLNATIESKTKQIQIMTQTMVEKDKLAVLGKLAGQIAHELRTPLSIINNSAYLLRKEGAKDKDLFEKRLRVLEDKVKLSSNILESILSYSRVKAEAAAKISIKDCITEVLKDLEIPHEIKVKIQTKPEDEALSIFMDFHQLYSVLRNIAINAVHAMKDKGTLTIELFSTNKKSIVNIRICDTGHGIEEKNKEKIFTLFFSTKITGTGLGLSIAKSIVEANMGELTLEKTSPKGTCFLIKIPAAKY